MSRVEIKDGQPIYWFDGKTPKRNRKGKNGVPIVEKLPATPWRYAIKPSGHVIALSLTSAAADRNVHGAAAMNRRIKKDAAGFLWADECPIAAGTMPRELRQPGDKPCEEYVNDDGKAIQGPKDKVCKHAQRVIDARVAVQAAAAKVWDERMKRPDQRMLEVLLGREERELEREERAAAGARGKAKAGE